MLGNHQRRLIVQISRHSSLGPDRHSMTGSPLNERGIIKNGRRLYDGVR
ncbi:hypothetical Protein YC6258_04675 [Gynuella sunshinyii YC6258]|uniref:Uncharacterized protein n=1 Tax=Gynuella sunshinyii YC6258 TaxID=1445510 RepID=A0A0C5VTT2_9GAMM|nr:hypothetical Protein YC6258_04675 [Gynuella sunshinyii YC6258]